MRALQDVYSVWWADLRIFRHLCQRFLITSLMSPVLYLLAFGFGLGRGMTVEGVDYLEFVIPGIMALTAMTTSFNAAGMKLNIDRLFLRSFDEMLMAPIGRVPLVMGKSVIGVVRGLIISFCFLIIGLAVSSMNVTPLFLLSLLVSCFMFAFMGVLCAMLTKSHQDMGTFSSVILTPMTFLGGTFFSLEQFPKWLEVVFYLLPLTHSSRCLRAEALGQGFPWLSFFAMLAFGAVFFWLCLVAVRRSSV
ncbi:MAG: ABC transporter permease [Chloroflexota bacterium]|nr:ABC transporter permease [Chloroflexota bacterium]